MRITSLSLVFLAACLPPEPAIHADPDWDPQPRPADYLPPPGAQGITLSGPVNVSSGDTELWEVTAPDLAVGDRVAIGWGELNQPGFCPYRRLVGGWLCLDIDNPTRPARYWGTSTAIADPNNPGAAVAQFFRTVPNTPLDTIYLQALKVDRNNSATSNVLPVNIVTDFCAVANGGCDQICTNTPTEAVCSCESGYAHDGSGGCDPIRIFGTSSNYQPGTAPFAGTASGDSICQSHATSAGLLDPAKWYALLSDSTRSARERGNPTYPLYNAGGDFIATDDADLWDGTIANTVRYNENGSTGVGIWHSGTIPDGSAEAPVSGFRTYCSDWTSTGGAEEIGRPDRTDGGWIGAYHPGGSSSSCNANVSLLCISGEVCPVGTFADGAGNCGP